MSEVSSAAAATLEPVEDVVDDSFEDDPKDVQAGCSGDRKGARGRRNACEIAAAVAGPADAAVARAPPHPAHVVSCRPSGALTLDRCCSVNVAPGVGPSGADALPPERVGAAGAGAGAGAAAAASTVKVLDTAKPCENKAWLKVRGPAVARSDSSVSPPWGALSSLIANNPVFNDSGPTHDVVIMLGNTKPMNGDTSAVGF